MWFMAIAWTKDLLSQEYLENENQGEFECLHACSYIVLEIIKSMFQHAANPGDRFRLPMEKVVRDDEGMIVHIP